MNWDMGNKNLTPKVTALSLDDYTPHERSVLSVLLEKSPVMIDELSWKSNLSISLLASVLLGLEFNGIVKSHPGKMYSLI